MTAPATPRFALSAQKRAVLDALLRREGTAPAPAPDPEPAIPPAPEGAPSPSPSPSSACGSSTSSSRAAPPTTSPPPCAWTGPLDVAALARALDALVAPPRGAAHHLRRRRTGRPSRSSPPPAPCRCPWWTWRRCPPARARGRGSRAGPRGGGGARSTWRAGPLLRAALLRLGPAEHVLLLTMHHIVSDGWSMGVLVRELARALRRLRRGAEPSPLPGCRCSTPTTPSGSASGCRARCWRSSSAYWRQQLGRAAAALELPTDRPRPAVQTFRGAHVPVRPAPRADRRR